MNRYKKEEMRKYRNARIGLSPNEIEELNRQEARIEDAQLRLQKLHFDLFPEEHLTFFDTTSDARDRTIGINPMSSDYIKQTDTRRAALGVSKLSANGLPTINDSWDYVLRLVKVANHADFGDVSTRR